MKTPPELLNNIVIACLDASHHYSCKDWKAMTEDVEQIQENLDELYDCRCTPDERPLEKDVCECGDPLCAGPFPGATPYHGKKL